MHDVRIDTAKNRIYVTVGALDNEAEMQQLVDRVKEECVKLKRGFTCLTDLRDYEYQDQSFEDYIKQAQEALLKAGMSKVVRVHRKVGLLGHYQFETVSLDLGYHARNATSIQEGERILDEEE
jgi:hypothetical protein